MRKTKLYRIFIVSILLLLLPLIGFTASAGEAEDYAPILYFEGQESCYPVSVDYYLANAVLSSTTIESETVTYYDANEGILSEYQNKLKSNDPSVSPTVYYWVDTFSGNTVIQYWMFYVYNPGEHNQHEGDWEMVQIVVPNAGEKWVAYSQHYSGQKATWDLVEKEGNSFKVYVARGSHANYLRSYSGKLGVASDIVGDNGRVLKPGDYTLVELSSQDWLDDDVLWGAINSVDDFFMGSAGPQGPQFRTDMSGTNMWNGVTWGSGLMDANGTLFLLESFLYNFMTILVLVTLAILSITLFKIYKRYKKHGLGPRIVSMFYIDGPNLHTIGNVLCFVGIILAIIGLFGTLYTVSANIDTEFYQSSGMTEVINLNGANGMQIFMPTHDGPAPMGSVAFPFAYVLLIGIFFMILSTIGIHKSHKIGMKYIFNGIRFIVLVIIIIIVLMFVNNLAGIAPSGGSGDNNFIPGLLSAISSSPTGGTYSVTAVSSDIPGDISFQWGLGSGAIYLLISGVILLVAGMLEIFAKKEFFQPKNLTKKETLPIKSATPMDKPAAKKKEEKKPETGLCPHCGKKLLEGAEFCTNCGKKL